MSEEVRISGSALSSVAAALDMSEERKARTAAERKAYHELLSKCVRTGKPHKQRGGLENRVYTVTTIAASEVYGGTRTPILCSSFEKAVQVVVRNSGDIFECSYSLAAIEAIVLDCMYSTLIHREVYWYMWEGDSRDGGYVPIEAPPGWEDRGEFTVG